MRGMPAKDAATGRTLSPSVIECSEVAVAVRVRTIVVLTTGLRDEEIAGLRLRNITLDSEVPAYDIVEAVKLHGPEGWANPGKLKTESSSRCLPMHPAARDALREWLTVH